MVRVPCFAPFDDGSICRIRSTMTGCNAAARFALKAAENGKCKCCKQQAEGLQVSGNVEISEQFQFVAHRAGC